MESKRGRRGRLEPQLGAALRGELSLADAVAQIKHATHRFIRHQYAWFRLSDERIRWFDLSRVTMAAAVERVTNEE
jgi:tRNA A37 N6-isopentenylltransferase MiaA